MPPPLPSSAPSLRGFAGFAAGFTTPWTGFRYMNRHPQLWGHAVLPILCNLVLTTLLIVGLVFGGIELYEWIAGFIPETWSGWYAKPLKVLSALTVIVVALGLTIAGWILFQGIFCGYFYSLLARQVEIRLGLAPEAMREVPLWYQVLDACLDGLAVASVAVGCLLLNIIPVIGSVAAMVIGGYFNCMVFGMEYLDYPQALRARGRKTQRLFARRHRAVTLGLGASVMLLTFIPLLNSVLLTTAATGAVLLYRRLGEPDAAAGVPATARIR